MMAALPPDHPTTTTHTFDERRWPLVTLVVPCGGVSTPNFDSLAARFEALLERDAPFSLVLDFRSGDGLNVERREQIRELSNRVREAAGRYVRGVAIVADSPFRRAAITATVWLIRPVFAIRVFDTVREAEAWALARIEQPSERRLRSAPVATLVKLA